MKKLLLLLGLFLTITIQSQSFWTEASPFPLELNARPKQISIVNSNIVWIDGVTVGSAVTQKWARSLDNGLTWTSGDIDLGNSALDVSCLHAISATTAYVTAD